MPSSPMVQNRDRNGESVPGWAILAFVSVAEKRRFEEEFRDKSIVSPTAITMEGRGLVCRTVHEKSLDKKGSSRGYSPERGNRESGRRSPGRGRHVTGNPNEAPVGPGSRSYDAQQWPHYVNGWGHVGGNVVPRSYNPQQWLPQPYSGSHGYTPADYCNAWPQLNATAPMGPTARPPTWANCRCMDLPRFPTVSPRTRLWGPGWTRGI